MTDALKELVTRLSESVSKVPDAPWDAEENLSKFGDNGAIARIRTNGDLEVVATVNCNLDGEDRDAIVAAICQLRNAAPHLLPLITKLAAECEAARKAFRTCGDGETVVWFNNGQPKTSIGGDGVQAMIESRDETDLALSALAANKGGERG